MPIINGKFVSSIGQESASTVEPSRGLGSFAGAVGNRALDAVSFGARSLEPLQFAQDLMFNGFADIFNPTERMGDRVRRQFSNISDYAPFGETPERYTTGRDIAELLPGMKEDSRASAAVGFGLDIFADPLAFGAYLNMTAKGLKAIKAADEVVGSVEGLARAADAMANPGWEFYKSNAKAQKFVEDRILLPTYALAGSKAGGDKSQRNFADFLPFLKGENTAASLANEVQKNPFAQQEIDRGEFGDFNSRFAAIRSISRGQTVKQNKAKAEGAQLANDLIDSLERTKGLLSGKVLESQIKDMMVEPAAAAMRTFEEISSKGYKPLLRDTIAQEFVNLSDNIGPTQIFNFGSSDETIDSGLNLLARRDVGLSALRERDEFGVGLSSRVDSPDDGARLTFNNPQQLTNQTTGGLDAKPLTIDKLYNNAIDKIADLAKKDGLDSDVVIAGFNKAIAEQTLSDAKATLAMSGYPLVRDTFIASLYQKAGVPYEDGSKAWVKLLGMGQFKNRDELKELTLKDVMPLNYQVPTTGEAANFFNKKLDTDLARNERADLGIARDDLFSSIDVLSMVESVGSGHLLQSYAYSANIGDIPRYTRAFGREFLTRNLILDENLNSSGRTEGNVQNAFRDRLNANDNLPDATDTFGEAEQTVQDLVREYADTISSTGRIAPTRSGSETPKLGRASNILRVDGLEEFIGNKINDPEKAQDIVKELITAASPAYAGALKRAETRRLSQTKPTIGETIDNFARRQGSNLEENAGEITSIRERGQLTLNQLEFLSPMMNAEISFLRQAATTKQQVTVSGSMSEIHKFADSLGLIKEVDTDNARVPRGFQTLPPSEAFGSMSGKAVAPVVYKMATDSLKDITQTTNRIDRMRNLITGGFLTGGSVITANLVGSTVQATMAGFNPVRHMKGMAETLAGVMEGKKNDTGYFPLELLQTRLDLSNVNISREVANNVKVDTDKILNLSEEYGEIQGRVGEVLGDLTRKDGRNASLQAAFNQLVQITEGQINKPGINGLGREFTGKVMGGLETFHLSEVMTRTSVFNMSLQDEYAKLGLDPLKNWDDYTGLSARDQAKYNVAIDRAADDARMANFDYQELPRYVDKLSRGGLIPFAGFEYLIQMNTAKAFSTNPSSLSVYNNAFDAIAETQFDDEVEKGRAYHAMSDWLQNDGGIPIGQRSDGVYRTLPLRQLVPIGAFEGYNDKRMGLMNALAPSSGYLNSAGAGGLWSPLMDMALAYGSGDGQSKLKAQFGAEVFRPGATSLEAAQDTAGFAWNSLAPGYIKKLVGTYNSYNESEIAGQSLNGFGLGLGGGIAEGIGLRNQARVNEQDAGVPLPKQLVDLDLTIKEAVRNRNERDRLDNIITSFVRSTQPISTGDDGSAYQNVVSILRAERANLNRDLGNTRKRIQAAKLKGDNEKAARLEQRMVDRVTKFNEQWEGKLAFYEQ